MKRRAKPSIYRTAMLGLMLASCSLDDAGPTDTLAETTQAAIVTFTPGPTAKFIPFRTGAGDADFKGHGPNVTVDATLSVRNQTELWATIHMHALETRSDWTESEGSQDVLLHTNLLPIRVVSDPSSVASYTDSNHADDTLVQPAGELVNRFICTGDTDGSEAGTRTGVRVFWNAITVEQVRDSCVNHCGGSSGACWCDDACSALGDCCADKCTVCGGC